MITEIGIVAGEIWHILDREENLLINEIAERIKKPKELVLMSVGWLAREGHVVLHQEEGGWRVSLRK